MDDSGPDASHLCNYRWSTTVLVHDQDKTTQIVKMKCRLPENHREEHIDWARVTATNEEGNRGR